MLSGWSQEMGQGRLFKKQDSRATGKRSLHTDSNEAMGFAAEWDISGRRRHPSIFNRELEAGIQVTGAVELLETSPSMTAL